MNPASSQQIIAKASHDFHGGIYPPENKDQSMQLPLTQLPVPEELVFPLNQHMGAPAEPIVSVGDHVLGGQKIAEALGAFSAAIHTSSSGEVSAIEDRVLPHTSGMSGPCIVIKTDGNHEFLRNTPCENYQALKPKEILEKIRQAGITGLGGAGFPTAVKLHPKDPQAITTLILNGTECEPYITADHSLMLNYAEEIIEGARLFSYLLGNPKEVIIGVEDNKPDAIDSLELAAQRVMTRYPAFSIKLVTFPTKYPSGGEKQLIELVTGKQVPSGAIPANIGIVMQNVGTAVAAYRAVRYGIPLTSRITTFVGESLNEQRNAEVLLGTPIDFALEQLGFDSSQNERLIMGGPMMGFTLPSASVPVVKTTNCIIAPTREELPSPPPAQECIRCGHCAEACPANLLPQQLYWYSKAEDYERAQNHNLFDCIECGACAYVCPSSIPLVQYYRAAKGAIRQHDQEKIKSDHARQRFEFRQLRIEKAEAEKAEKRRARQEAAAKAKKLQAEKTKTDQADKPTESTNDPVAAAMARMQAQKNDPAEQKARLERNVSSARDRLKKLEDKLSTIEDEAWKDKTQAQIKQTELRLQEAEKQLAEVNSSNNEKSQEQKPSGEKKDAATIAIEKAKAKAAAQADMSTKEKLEQQIASLKPRLEKAKERLSKAQAENSEHINAFQNSVDKLEQKLTETVELLKAEKEDNNGESKE